MLKGVPFIICFNLCFILHGSIAKFLPNIPFYDLVLGRALLATILCLAWFKYKKIRPLGNNRRLLLLRGITGGIGILTYYFTLQVLPFVLAVALQFLSPVFTVIFTLLITKQPPTKIQLFTLCFSLLGALLIYNIIDSELSPYAIIGIISAICSGASYSNIAILKESEHTTVILFYLSFVTLILDLPYTIGNVQIFTIFEYYLIFAAAIAAFAAQITLTKAYQLSSAYIIAPLTYLNIVFASIIGYIFWHEVISSATYLGIFLIVACNIIMLRAYL